MKMPDILIKCGLALFAITVFVNTIVYKMPNMVSIIIYGAAAVLIIIGVVLLRGFSLKK